MVEAPDGNRYSWLPVRGGQAVFELPIEGALDAARAGPLPAPARPPAGHASRVPGNATDLGRPATFGATVWLEVEPVANRLQVELAHPPQARPGRRRSRSRSASGPAGRGRSRARSTLWLVDQAVMALGARGAARSGAELPLRSPSPLRGARHPLAGVRLPAVRRAAGRRRGRGERVLLDRQTVRKNFQAVPFYEPSIAVGPDGVAQVPVTLSDDLTNFLVRAKAVAGDERFGFATGRIEVRQPVVRAAVAAPLRPPGRPLHRHRGGAHRRRRRRRRAAPRRASRGSSSRAGETQPLEWVREPRQRASTSTSRCRRRATTPRGGSRAPRWRSGSAPSAPPTAPATPSRCACRSATTATACASRRSATLAPGEPCALPEPAEPARAGSLVRKLLVSSEPGTGRARRRSRLPARLPVRLHRAAALDRARAARAARASATCSISRRATTPARPRGRRHARLAAAGAAAERAVRVLAGRARDRLAHRVGGRVPGRGEGGRPPVDADARGQGAAPRSKQALRSDYSGFLDGESWAERTWALRGARARRQVRPRLRQRARAHARSSSISRTWPTCCIAFDRAGRADSPALAAARGGALGGHGVRLHQGREIYGGLQETRSGARNGLDPARPRPARWPSMTRALVAARLDAEEETEARGCSPTRWSVSASGDGWGSTNANAAAILALAERLGRGQARRRRGERRRSRRRTASATLTLGAGEPDRASGSRPRRAGPTLTLAPGGAAAGARRAPRSPISRREDRRRRPRAATASWWRASRSWPRAGGAPPRALRARCAGHARSRSPSARWSRTTCQVVNPQERHYVAIVVPLAAGMEPLNPNLDTAPPEAKPASRAHARADLRRLPRRPGRLLLRHPAHGHLRLRLPHPRADPRHLPAAAGQGRDDVRRQRGRQRRGGERRHRRAKP